MPNEPDNQSKMHQLLQAYARKRRQDAGVPAELHPATRGLLQAEVEQRFGGKPKINPSPETGWARLIAMWPRLAFGLAIFLALGVAVGVIIHRERPSALRLAQNSEPASREIARTEAAPRPVREPAPKAEAPAPPRPAQALSPQRLEASTGANRTDVPGATPNQPPSFLEVNAPAGPKLSLGNEAAPRLEMRKVGQVAVVPPPEPLAVSTAPVPAMAPIRLTSASADASAAKEDATVLTNFEFQQTGDQVRVIDADGSVYAGKVLGNTPAERVGATTAVAADSETKAQPDPVRRALTARNAYLGGDQGQGISVTNALAAYSFQVRGTNLRSRRSVELEGVLMRSGAAVATDQAAGQPAVPAQIDLGQALGQTQAAQRFRFYRANASNGLAPPAPGAARSRAAAPITNLPALQRIQGTLRVGGGNAQPIDAVQTGK